MRNKLKRSKKSADASSSPSKDPPRTSEVITAVSSESRGSAGETEPGKHGSDVAAAGISATHVLEQRRTTVSGGIRVAPIFLRHNESDRGSDCRSGRPAERRSALQVKESEERLSAGSQLTERKGPGTGPPAPSDLHSCLREIQTSNPAFPARAVFSTLQRKTCLQHSNQLNMCRHDLKEKRKLRDESPERMPKRLRSGLTGGSVGMGQCQDVLMVRKQPSRTQRLKLQSGSPAETVSVSEWRRTQLLKTPDVIQRSSFDDVLWTDKYSPQHSSEVVGNSASVSKLQWLKKWKLRAVKDERRKAEERKPEENSNSWDCGDFQGEAGEEDDREEPLCNAMLITGPPGTGKTASVYACSQELGFKVFEVNCSSARSGCHVLSQLREATQSHLVEIPGKDPLKPAYLNNYSSASKSETGRRYSRKTAALKNVTSTSKRRVPQNSGRSGRKGKARAATVSLASYFTMRAKAAHSHAGGPPPSVKPGSKTSGSYPPGSNKAVTRSRQTATSLILFEEVDVIFDVDFGFLAAIKTFMTSTKRPVVLTTNKTVTTFKVNVCSYLQLVGLAENARLARDDAIELLGVYGGDVRRCLLQLQLWAHSGGGRAPCAQTVKLLGLLAESWRRCVPLLYSNLELLLGASVCSGPRSDLASPNDHIQQLRGGSVDPRASTPGSKSVISRLSRRKYTSKSDATSSSSSSSGMTQTPGKTSILLAGAPSRDKTDQQAAKVANDRLAALSDFFDLMSCLDSTMPAAAPLVSGSCRPGAFVWTGGEIKDGLSDETSEEEDGVDGGSSEERLSDIRAAVEGLGCRRCLRRMSEASAEARIHREELGGASWRRPMETRTSPASSRGQRLSFSFQPPWLPVSQRRYKLSKKLLGGGSLGLLGNRNAVSVDYIPVLRGICRFQREQRREEPVCLNYIGSKNLGLSKSTIQLLAEDFSECRTHILI
uniref:Atad5b n=1 Tax=Cryptopsaras couesii TaxID=412659 RepID=A0AA49GMR2_CRYCE|nr:Atad5b [Cryptopsaras couesii]